MKKTAVLFVLNMTSLDSGYIKSHLGFGETLLCDSEAEIILRTEGRGS